jgi:hypothetical protein
MYKLLRIATNPVIILLVFLFLPHFIFAAPPTFNDDVDDVPIDGGIAILAAAGILLGGIGYMRKKSTPNN